jgi:16S rRNA (adenine1518-N6/adenine1519-N6)-dimethyltransferase
MSKSFNSNNHVTNQPFLRPKKSLGQHFLNDSNILASIADAAAGGGNDTVVEVGPGKGSLTLKLAAQFRTVVALELDTNLVAFLRPKLPKNVQLYETDARGVSITELLGNCPPYTLVGNLPYYAALPILRHFLENTCQPSLAIVMVQLEVARQMCAQPGEMSLLSVAIQLHGRPRLIRTVKPGSFWPVPKVKSALVAIDVFPKTDQTVLNTNEFFRIVRAGFSAPRKQLLNSLAQGLITTSKHAERLLLKAGIDPRRRAQTLSISEWIILYECSLSDR